MAWKGSPLHDCGWSRDWRKLYRLTTLQAEVSWSPYVLAGEQVTPAQDRLILWSAAVQDFGRINQKYLFLTSSQPVLKLKHAVNAVKKLRALWYACKLVVCDRFGFFVNKFFSHFSEHIQYLHLNVHARTYTIAQKIRRKIRQQLLKLCLTDVYPQLKATLKLCWYK